MTTTREPSQRQAVSYIHPSSGAEVADVECPTHKKIKGHVTIGQIGKATCGFVLKSHKETGPEEIVDGKKVRPVKTVVDSACTELLVPVEQPKKGGKVAVDAEEKPGTTFNETERAEKFAGKRAKSSKGDKKGAKGVGRHPDAV